MEDSKYFFTLFTKLEGCASSIQEGNPGRRPKYTRKQKFQ